MKEPRLAPTALIGDQWDLGDIGTVELTRPSAVDVILAQDTWSPIRPPKASCFGWSWPKIYKQSWETLCVRTVLSRVTLSMFSTEAHRLLQLPLGPCYRPDWIEVAPSAIGQGVGAFTLAVIAGRALEAGACAVVLASVPEAVRFYANMGGKAGPIKGWRVDRSLTPFLFDEVALSCMWSEINGQASGDGTILEKGGARR